MEFDKKEMGRRISERREKLKIKQNALAEKLDINNNHLSSIETGKVSPSLDLFIKICKELKVTPDYLLEGAMHSNNVPENMRMGVDMIIDPSAASFIAAIKRSRLGFRVRKADNAVTDGIRDAAVCLQRGTVRVFENCDELRKEFDGYVWDTKAEDKPVKVNDHLMDAMRYLVRTKRLVKPASKYISVFGG